MTDEHATAGILARAQKLLNSRYLKQAQRPQAEAEVNDELENKMAHLSGDAPVTTRIKALTGQAAELWKNRSQLSGKHALYLTAGLLYFISPFDAVTDIIPVLGYIDDAAVLGWILAQIVPAVNKLKDQVADVKDATIHQATDQLVDKGRDALNELVDQRTDELLGKLDAAAEDAVQKYVTAVVIGLWGTTTAAALSLVLTSVSGSYTREWMVYVGTTTTLVLAWNIAVAVVFLRQYRSLDSRIQEKLPKIIGAKVGRWRHVLAVALPVLAFVGLGLAHWYML